MKTKKINNNEKAEIYLGVVDNYIDFHMTIASTLSMRTFLSRVEDHPRNARFIILMLIHLNPEITQIELSRTAFRDKSSMSPLLKEFFSEGLITRAPTTHNGRAAQAITLTPAGEELLALLKPHAEAQNTMLHRILGDEDHCTMLRILRKLTDGLKIEERNMAT